MVYLIDRQRVKGRQEYIYKNYIRREKMPLLGRQFFQNE
jgi:hypothetical protein